MRKIDDIYKYLILSTFAALFIFLFAFLDNSYGDNIVFHDRLIVSILFIISCIFGLSLAIYPRWYNRISRRNFKNNKSTFLYDNKIKRKGHHPDCDQFYSHTLKFKNKTFCAGCFGLSIGSIISIFLMIIYLFFISNLSNTFLYLLLTFGFIIIGFVYVEIQILKRKKLVHVTLNVLLVLSFFMITFSILEITNNISYGMISIVLSFLWLDTRIQLSNRKHILICANCIKSCKMY